ncbi:MAG: imidazole glycerol phosphate synthase subunit HisH [Myxococcales bacterium]|nr:imidazole glycerol phosphate synthase subunit HisH [Myxococcales bacterium]
MSIVVVDLGMGNLRSVTRALTVALGEMPEAPALIESSDPAVVAAATVAVVPGQGGFGDCARALGRGGGAMRQALYERLDADRPYLGICLGLQCLFGASEESPGAEGIGYFGGAVRRFTSGLRDAEGAPLKIPHMGWNDVRPEGPIAALVGEASYYFVHSYFVEPDPAARASLSAATTEHGVTFVSALARGAMLGVQFHPEKSQRAGLSLLRRYFKKVLR